ncbi:prephenate dehydrogenase dimerization domain-containing protein [Sporolactobacillus kofuensis]|uniref:Prephenate dehydrogenase dimerization domain-containing protein n=1 Tax=Sporolactobacillus kofuensis TaxID=269672 RepID=A0ABW1WBR2_9BACL|nr:prephenate dehydrogenase dimerization domain-containing protein [Sporolactobacillus kofuensis]MCO7175219.1 prephenate dehydrogenase/arogenate dehydrogenase family protein [Sporolactobacillus kofuensis]
MKTLLSGLQVCWQQITAEEHDQVVGQLSHLPHIIAAGLVNMTKCAAEQNHFSLDYAAGGFKSTTRIAASDPQLWTAILQSNSSILIQQIEQFCRSLDKVKRALQKDDREGINQFFEQAKAVRTILDHDSQ